MLIKENKKPASNLELDSILTGEFCMTVADMCAIGEQKGLEVIPFGSDETWNGLRAIDREKGLKATMLNTTLGTSYIMEHRDPAAKKSSPVWFQCGFKEGSFSGYTQDKKHYSNDKSKEDDRAAITDLAAEFIRKGEASLTSS